MVNLRKINEFGLMKFDEKKIVGTAKIEIGLSENDIDNIIVTGLEGGINYWAKLQNVGELWKDKPKEVSISQWVTHLLINGYEVQFSDTELMEGEDDYLFPSLTLDKLMKGYAQNHKERPWDSSIENGDATTSDCIIQYAIFGKLVYG